MGYKEDITKIYVGYYDRAPDPAGLNYWIGRAEAGMSLSEIAESFSVQPESTAKYPYLANPLVASADSFIDSVYMNLFNRMPDDAGKAYWLSELAGGKPVGQMIIDIMSGAQDSDDGNDLTTLNNKVAVGIDFAEKASEISDLDYENNGAAKAAAADVLDGVDDTEASVEEGKQETVDFIDSGAGVGTTIPLTNGTDTGADFTGTEGVDIFVAGPGSADADDHTLGNGDELDGSGGMDVLRVTTGDDSINVSPTLTNIELIDARNPDWEQTRIDLSNSTGVTDVQLTNGRGSVFLDNASSEIDQHAVSNNNDWGNVSVRYQDGVDLGGDVNFFTNGARTDFWIGQDGLDVDTVNIDSSGSESRANIGLDNFAGGDPNPTTLNVTGDAALELNSWNSVQEGLTEVNISNTGGVDVNLAANEEDITVNGGSGDDIFHLDENEFNTDDTIDGGDGDDKISIQFGGGRDLTDEDDDGNPENDIVLGFNSSTSIEDAEFLAGGDVEFNASHFTSVNDFTVRENGSNTLNDVIVHDVENDDNIQIRGGSDDSTVNNAEFNAEGDADTLNVKVRDIDSVNRTAVDGFDEANITLDHDDMFMTDVEASNDTNVKFHGEAERLNLELIGNGDGSEDLTLDASGVETDGEIETDTNGNDETIYNAGDANWLTGTQNGDDTIIGTAQDDVIDGNGNFAPTTPVGVTTIDLNALDDLDADEDGAFDTAVDDDGLVSVTVTVDGRTITVAANNAEDAATLLAANISVLTPNGNPNVDTATADNGVVTITSTTSTAVNVTNLQAGVDPATYDATADATGAYEPTSPAASSVFTIDVADSGISVNDTYEITITDTDGATDQTETVLYTVLSTDIGADDAATAANVAAGIANAIIAAQADTAGDDDLGGVTVTRVGDVVTVTADVAGTATSVTAVESQDPAGIAVTTSNAGTDAVATETQTFETISYVGQGTLNIEVDGITATLNGAGAGTNTFSGDAIADALRAADVADGGIDTFTDADTGNGTLLFNAADDTAPTIDISYDYDTQVENQNESISVEEENGVTPPNVGGQDTYTGGDGNDVFVINSQLNEDGEVTAAGADEVTDFSDGDLLDFINTNTGGLEDNYAEGPLAGFGNFAGALSQAQSDFEAADTSATDLLYSAQYVEDEGTYIFVDANYDNDADGVVFLAGVNLSDLDDDGSFIAV